MRVAVGGFYHETNTFSATTTGPDQFRAYQFAAGDEIVVEIDGVGRLANPVVAAGQA